jgi:uncharacterized MAPEG superfamily protein
MTPELTILGWTLVLAVVQILLPAFLRTKEAGIAWNASARDHDVEPVGKVTGRLLRAQKNLYETLPLFIAAVLIAHGAGISNDLTVLGAKLYLTGRIVYLPLYAFGVPYVRSLVWVASMAGLALILAAILL